MLDTWSRMEAKSLAKFFSIYSASTILYFDNFGFPNYYNPLSLLQLYYFPSKNFLGQIPFSFECKILKRILDFFKDKHYNLTGIYES